MAVRLGMRAAAPLAAIAMLTGGCGGARPDASPTASAAEATSGSWWHPAADVTFQWQLAGEVDISVAADVFDVDLFETPAAVIEGLAAAGSRTICYLSAGSVEDWRPDAERFPAALIGNDLDGWPGERWLDVRALDELAPLMRARLDRCAEAGYDGVEFDNVNAYEADSGFDIGPGDQLAFNRWLAAEAHLRGLAAVLKNDTGQAAELVDDFDLLLLEECVEFEFCGQAAPFIDAGKLVVDVEYALEASEFCAATQALGIVGLRKRLELDAWAEHCGAGSGSGP